MFDFAFDHQLKSVVWSVMTAMKQAIIFISAFLLPQLFVAQQWSPVIEGNQDVLLNSQIRKLDIINSTLFVSGGFYDGGNTYAVVSIEGGEFQRMMPYSDDSLGKGVAPVDSGFCSVGSMNHIGGEFFFNNVSVVTDQEQAHELPNVLFQSGKAVANFQDELIIAAGVATWNGSLDYEEELGIVHAKISSFDGDSVRFIGTPLGNEIFNLTEFNGSLYVTGHLAGFTNDMTIESFEPAGNIMRYDGEQWFSVGEGINNVIADACVHPDEDLLFLGGDFTSDYAGTEELQHIAAWNGDTFLPIGDGLPNGVVRALSVYRGQLYAGGNNIIDDYDLVYFNGATWKPVDAENGGIRDGLVREMIVFEDHLYIAGNFSEVPQGLMSNGFVKYYLDPANVDVGTQELEKERGDVKVYPNPNKGLANLEIPQEYLHRTYDLVDLNGRSAQQGVFRMTKETLDLSNLNSGTYLLKIEGVSKSVRIVIQ